MLKPRKYTELSSATIDEGVEIVISRFMDEGFTLAKKVCVVEGKRKVEKNINSRMWQTFCTKTLP